MIDSIKQKLEKLNPSKPTNLKKAGVLIAILNYEEYIDSPSIIYTQRSSIVSTHSGEVSFPGGMMEDIDTDLYQTALRESHEEMNLDPSIVTRIGRLNYLISRYDIEVNPFVAVIDEKPNLEGNSEIEEIFEVPIEFLLNKNNMTTQTFQRDNMKLEMPTWYYNDQKIWGLTAMITADLLNICFDANIGVIRR
ncbi:CoA pyrophosphatase [Gammaproteobacteria bacterium]|nr:CoA pyrophosphatase [Gammaproteobacteria bacterium]|tara:strand:- start:1366 stop:1944 length:579 start_codon:yes stop_codon:yes gene_type:complete